MKLDPGLGAQLLGIARDAILTSLSVGADAAPPDRVWEGLPGKPGASFVTLETGARLRGCCGTVRSHRMLAVDVWENARRSAFGDPRFPPLEADEVDASTLTVSVLGPLHPVEARTEDELLGLLRPGRDGVVIALGSRQATFLPKVWNMLPEPAAFIRQLKQKMGLPAAFWDEALKIQRYETAEVHGTLSIERAEGRGRAPASTRLR